LELPEAASDRSIDVELGDKVIEVGERVYLRRFSPMYKP
jgi:hypothetical protein